MVSVQSLTLTEAVGQYLGGLKQGQPLDGRQELNRFVQWCGRDRGVSGLTPVEVAEYAESAGMWGTNSADRLKLVKSFLTYLKQKGLIGASLAPHLKPSRAKKGSRRVYFKSAAEQAHLTPEGLNNLQLRLEMLKEERIKIVADIGRAMADKDFKENAPLDAAKERQGLVESGIRELEGIVTHAVVTDSSAFANDKRVRLGKKVTLRDLGSGKKVSYRLVDTRETDPVTGKISSVSPVGRALLDKEKGDEVNITVPKGTLHYVIEKIER